VHKPVDRRGDKGAVDVDDLAHVAESTIRGQHDRPRLVTGGNDLKQQACLAVVEGRIAQPIEEE
jgi:hypothetical protein